MKEVDLIGIQLEPTTKAPLVLLAEREAPNRILPLLVGSAEGAAIALALSDALPPRPMTHDLMVTLVHALGGEVTRVEVTEVRDETFLAVVAVHTATGEVQVDARPSDAIALAVRVGAPVLVSDEVLEQSGVILAEPSEVAIDAELDQFRAFLDGVSPDDFAEVAPDEAPGPEAEQPAAPPTERSLVADCDAGEANSDAPGSEDDPAATA